jgi:formylglycine-generating enzyme
MRYPALEGRLRALSAARLSAALLLGGCGAETMPQDPRAHEDPAIRETAQAVAAPSLPPAEPVAAPSGPCAPDMAVVAGAYCLTPEQKCIEHQDIPSGERGVVPNQCLRFAEPVSCYDDRRRPVRFCMDRYEWPNKKGELPQVLVSWQDARGLCAAAGKRLCTEDEFNFACEGEAMRPYVYGFARDATKCNFDRPYRPRTFPFLAWDACQDNAACKAAFEAIDQRMPSGSLEACRSAEGIYDLNGNVNEWVMLPGAKGPHRSGLKGGWWGPVRDRCRPTVTFHDEGDFGYEVGFRCCADTR